MQNGAFIVSGWRPPAEGLSELFRVYAGTGDVPPVMGSYSVEQGTVVFRPRFSLASGVAVRAVLTLPGRPPIESRFEVPRADAASTTRVRQVYPSSAIIPENQLKFYLEFSGPMQRGEAWRRIRLLDDKGSPVELPFLEIAQELWDRETRRLTVLFDPGRIKRGLGSLAEAGTALEEGRSYTVVIDRDWRDGSGAPLQQEFRKEFRVGPPDRDPPDPGTWQITAPAAGTSEPLVVRFPEPMDYALLHRLLRVENETGQVDGEGSTGPKEMEWRLVPRAPWQPGNYRVVVDTGLEDLAGNRIGRPFDVDIFERVTARVERKTVSLPFRIDSK